MPRTSGRKDVGGFAFNRFDLFHQLRTIERAAIAQRSHEHSNLQWSYLHLTLADCLVNHINVCWWVNDLALGLGDLFNAGWLAQTKGARHICDVILAVVLEQGIADVPEIWVAGTHQTFGQCQTSGGNAIGGIAFEARAVIYPGNAPTSSRAEPDRAILSNRIDSQRPTSGVNKPLSMPAAMVMTLNTEPSGYCPCAARLTSGLSSLSNNSAI